MNFQTVRGVAKFKRNSIEIRRRYKQKGSTLQQQDSLADLSTEDWIKKSLFCTVVSFKYF